MIKKIFVLFLIVTGIIGSSAQDKSKYEVKVGNFKQLLIADHVNVVYSCNADSVGFARFETTPELTNCLLFANNKGKLTIQVATESVLNPKLPTVYVYSDYLQSVDNAADSTVKIATIAPGPELKLKLSANGKIIARDLNLTTIDASIITGRGTIILEGKCTKATLKNVGTGEIQADKLIATDVNCQLLGTGSIGCNASNKLSIKGSGTAKVYYVGKPKEITLHQLGSIKAIPLDEK